MQAQWSGWWEQDGFGRQEMAPLTLSFQDGQIRGEGWDCIGAFTFTGHYDESGVHMMKHYVGQHQVIYEGQFDGEGVVYGNWLIPPVWTGRFAFKLLHAEEAAIQDVTQLAVEGDDDF